MGAELAMLDKRAVNLELTMARLRATTEALELSLRKLPDPGPAVPDETPAKPAPPPSMTVEEPRSDPAPVVAADALFTLEEEVPPSDWDEPPEDAPPPDPTWP